MSTCASRVASAAAFTLFMICGSAFAQRPLDPALLVPQAAAELDYVAVANPLTIPVGMVTGAPASVAFDKNGHLWVLYRGAQPFAEFDKNGKFLRAFGEGLFVRPHGLKFDKDGNIWATDVGGHVVYKVSPQGRILLKLGTGGRAGQINEPNDVAVGANGNVFVAQGHTPGASGDPLVVKFDRDGNFIKSWGGTGSGPANSRLPMGSPATPMGDIGSPIVKISGSKSSIRTEIAATGKVGSGPGEFGEAHAIAVSTKGEIWVADSINSTIYKFVRK